MAFSLVLSWERRVGRIICLVAAALGINVLDWFVAGSVTLQPCAVTLLSVLPLHFGLKTILTPGVGSHVWAEET